jgi:hypothetical protein
VPWNEQKTEVENLRNALPSLPLFEPTGETVDIGQGYNHGLRLNAGLMFWHDARPAQGVSVQLSGLDLQVLRHTDMTEDDLLHFIQDRLGHASTLHSCINIHDAGASVRALVEAHERGETFTHARRVGVYSSSSKQDGQWQTGETFYIGSPKSGVQIRVYDKAAEQGIHADWVRMEVVWRGKHARAAHARMLAMGIEATTRGAIAHQFSARLPWWSEAMRGELALPLPETRRESARSRWLRLTVAPALRREIAAQDRQGGGDLRALFLAIVSEPPAI